LSDLKQFLELFNPLPGNHYIQVTTQTDATTQALYELLQKVGGELRIAHFANDTVEEFQELFPEAKIQYINNFVNSFRALPRDHDRVVFKDIFHQHHRKDLLLKTAYTTLANTAEIIIMEKKGLIDVHAMMELLAENEFRAPNVIDVLPEYDLVMAKKMHMWGNGL
jgi:hypothetical protein